MSENNEQHHEQINVLSPDAKLTDATDKPPLTQAEISYKWFTKQGHYEPCTGIEVERLVCGEEAFTKIHAAIEQAQSSVDILIWGFDPMMKFNPNKSDETIGELLERKGKQGVKCRLMVWYDNLGKLGEPTLIGDTTVMSHAMLGMQASAFGGDYQITDKEWETLDDQAVTRRQNQRNALLKQKEQLLQEINQREQKADPLNVSRELTQKQLALKKVDEQLKTVEASLTGYEASAPEGRSRGPKQHPQDSQKGVEWIRRLVNGQIANVQYKARNFELKTTNNIVDVIYKNNKETNTNFNMRRALGNFTSHHQKVVLIDYEVPNSSICTAFVMGHNMHRAYWDTKQHYFYDEDANRVQGFGPWQDISTQVWGEILWDINENFVTAWELIKPKDGLREQRQHITKQQFKSKGNKHAQFCRTMPQVTIPSTKCYERSILALYKIAIANSYNYIFMENQYFRYKDIARQIKQHAEKLQDSSQKHGKEPPPLYLFVLTNSPYEWKYSSTTYEMFKELGQQQLLPETQRTLYEQKLKEKANLERLAQEEDIEFNASINENVMSQKDQEHIEPVKTKDDVAKMSQENQGWDIDGINGKKPFELEEIDGLKIVIGTLTSDSSVGQFNPHYTQGKPGAVYEYQTNYIRYRDIYIHSKLLIVDDLFTLVSSANINTRSFWVDSESGIAITDNQLATDMRNELWLMHTKKSINGGQQTASDAISCDAELNYHHWNDQMTENWKRKAKGEPLVCHLTRFWETEMPYAEAVD